MKKRSTHAQTTTFVKVLEAAKPQNAIRLADRARRANQIAKLARHPRHRALAYDAKQSALSQGIRCREFEVISDERGRPNLMVVCTGSHGMLHMPVHAAGPDLLDRPDIRVRFRGLAA